MLSQFAFPADDCLWKGFEINVSTQYNPWIENSITWSPGTPPGCCTENWCGCGWPPPRLYTAACVAIPGWLSICCPAARFPTIVTPAAAWPTDKQSKITVEMKASWSHLVSGHFGSKQIHVPYTSHLKITKSWHKVEGKSGNEDIIHVGSSFPSKEYLFANLHESWLYKVIATYGTSDCSK